MSLESIVKGALDSLVSNRVYPDVTPDNPTFPLIVYQQVGGEVVEYLEGELCDKDHARLQVWIWATTRLAVSTLARQVREALVESSIKATTYNAPVSEYDEALKKYGARIDFSIWYTP